MVQSVFVFAILFPSRRKTVCYGNWILCLDYRDGMESLRFFARRIVGIQTLGLFKDLLWR